MKNIFARLICIVFSFALIFSILACNSDSDEHEDEDDNIATLSDVKGLDSILEPNEDIKKLFDLNNKIEIELEISNAELRKINDDYNNYSDFDSKSPIYRVCNMKLKINDEVYSMSEVGVRMKGNTSRRSFYDETVGVYDMIHYKLSFGETFDKKAYYSEPKEYASSEEKDERKARNLFGMGKLDLKWNKNFDETHIKELNAYNFFREHNILAPRCNKAKVVLKTDGGTYNMGIFNMLECVDESFINRYLPQADRGGDLYKCAWGNAGGASLMANTIGGIGCEDEDIAFFPTYDLKTNKKTSDNALLSSLITQLNSKNVDALDSVLGQIIHEDYFLIYEAISYIVGNPDDLRNNYNNYYIYFLGSSNQAIFIPYDFDRVFGLNWDWNPTGNGMTNVEPLTHIMSTGGTQQNPLYKKTIVNSANTRLTNSFIDYLNLLKTSDYLNYDSFLSQYNIAKNHYQNDVIPSKAELTWAGMPFSVETSTVLNATNINIDFLTYINLKLDTLNNSL